MIADPDEAMNRLSLFACAYDELSLDIPTREGSHGLLTFSLYETLQAHAWDVSVVAAYEEVRDKVGAIAHSRDMEQTPQLRGPRRLMNNRLFR